MFNEYPILEKKNEIKLFKLKELFNQKKVI